ncbi:RNA polymerase subunit sigma [Photobacterium sanctipauli]|uniref:RNA polymerase sigma factor n=1 Tax=Photobacterium sanctipauli TaxID=1342794 RepID=A0A2T3P0Q9_9GAMM|nr:sigma-70 family RNA polymerase sigma factor [Photobacterium sanctipauli]PSW22105.1 RNA polymerase subunit sigma [Photobacterium sanctipauli]
MITEFIKTTLIRSSKLTRKQRYESLVSLYSDDLYRYAFWLCKDQHDAEDLVQETYLRAWRFIDDLADDKVAKSWLITILRRENARRFRNKPIEYVDIDDCHLFAEEQYVDNKQLLQEKIANLSSTYREPLLLQVLMGFTAEEVAQILNLNVNTVLTRLARAKKQLKEKQADLDLSASAARCVTGVSREA